MDDDVRYVYLEEDGEGVRVWPLEDSDIMWKGKPVLTRNRSQVIGAEYCDGYEPGSPGYHLASLGGDPPEFCENVVQVACVARKPKDRKLGGFEVKFPQDWDNDLKNEASSRLFHLLGEGTEQERLCWAEGSLSEWVDGAEVRRAEKAEQKKLKQQNHLLKQLQESGDAFINPYTFVPLPEKVERRAPSGHAQAVTGALTGYVDVEYTFRTPLMLPGDWKPVDTEGDVPIEMPGSSVRGSVRSLYETLSHSCLHVIDPDHLPVHRSDLEDRKQDRLAVVHETDNNDRVTKVLPTTKVIWAKAGALREQLGCSLKSGLRVDLDEGNIWERKFGGSGQDNRGRPVSRFQLKDSGIATVTANPKGAWVMHVADAGTKGGHPFDHIYVALGKLSDEPEEIPAEMWEVFRELCRHSKDVKSGKLADSAPEWGSSEWPEERVLFKGNEVGIRRRTDGMLAVGDSVWLVRDKKNKTTGLKMSYSWRTLGEHPLRKRLPDDSLLPCADPEDLCPACRVFGFVEQRTGSASNESRQNAYASHIRFLGFRSGTGAKVWSADPPPMRSPRASAGAFYLQHTKTEGGYLRQAGEPTMGKPSSRWGGPLDATPRRINGRKYYWHGQQPENTTPTPRHIRRKHYPKAEPEERRWFAPAGTVVKGRVLFENLLPEEVGLLLVSLDPQLLPEVTGAGGTDDLATHLGGGKGLGFGSAVASALEVHLEDAASRYLDAGVDGTATRETVLQAAAEVLAENRTTVEAVMKALGMKSVPADRIWYPTTGDFKHRDSKEQQKQFDSSFEYYAKFSGGQREKGAEASNGKPRGIRMRTLPSIHDPIQFMSNAPDPEKEQR